MAKDNPEFYEEEIEPQTGKPVQLIRDKDTAHTVALKEKEWRETEEWLRRMHKEGLTPEQQENIQLLNNLSGKYPDALIDTADNLGRRILILQTPSAETLDRTEYAGATTILFSVFGHAALTWKSNHEPTQLDLTPVIDYLVENNGGVETYGAKFYDIGEAPVRGKEGTKIGIQGAPVNLRFEHERAELRGILEKTQEEQTRLHQQGRVAPPPTTEAEAIIRDL